MIFVSVDHDAMRKVLHAIGLFSVLFSVCALAQSDVQTARKITISLHTSSVASSALPTPKSNGATPVLKATQSIGPVSATVISVAPFASKPPRRRLEYSEDHIAIVGLAADSSELTRIVMIDPRLVRVDALRGEGDLSSRHLYRQSVDFSFLVNDEAVVSIRILKPRWDGKKWLFDVLAEAQIE